MKTVQRLIFCPRKLAPIAAITLWFLVLCCDTCFGQDISKLVKDLRDQRINVRAAAARALGRIGPEAKAAVPALSKALKDNNADVRRAAARALKQMQPVNLNN